MLKKKYTMMIAKALTVAAVSTGLGFTNFGGIINGESNTVYADSVMQGMQTSTGVISGIVKYSDRIPQAEVSLDEMKSKSIEINPKSNPDFFSTQMVTGATVIGTDKINISNNIYHWADYNNEYGFDEDIFIHVYAMDLGASQGEVIKKYTIAMYLDGEYQGRKEYSVTFTDYTAYNYIKTESKVEEAPSVPSAPSNPTTPNTPSTPSTPSKPSTPSTPSTPSKPNTPSKPSTPSTDSTNKYSSTRLWGQTRFQTALSIAKSYNAGKVNSVVLVSAFDFPDALCGSVFAAQKNAPILLVGTNAHNADTINYIKNNLQSGGKVYILGGSGVVGQNVINSINALGINNIERIAGRTRYETNLEIINKMNVAKGTSVVVANSMVFADSLSVSSVASVKGMPIILAGNSLSNETLAKIKQIQPQNIYVVGGTGAVNTTVENQLKSLGSVTRISGPTRYETSIEIAKFFNLNTTNAVVADGMNFPDALCGSVLAAQKNAPILLVGKEANKQKSYLDSTKIRNIFVLGGTGAVSDSVVNQLTK